MSHVFDASPHDLYAMVIAKLVIGVVAVVATPFIAFAVLNQFQEARESNRWPVAPATITRSEVVQEHDGGKLRFVPKISYSYSVEGKPFSSDRVAFRGFGTPIRDHADEVAAKYPMGAQVQAHYNPRKMEAGVLEPGAGYLNYLGLFLPLLSLCVGSFMAYDHYRELRRRHSEGNAPKATNSGKTPAKAPGKSTKRRPPLRPLSE